jgi:hypothetical protein
MFMGTKLGLGSVFVYVLRIGQNSSLNLMQIQFSTNSKFLNNGVPEKITGFISALLLEKNVIDVIISTQHDLGIEELDSGQIMKRHTIDEIKTKIFYNSISTNQARRLVS